MRSRILQYVTLLMGLALAACQGAAGVLPTATPTAAPTLTPAPANPTPVPASAGQAECTVVGLLPTPDPAQSSPFPPLGGGDWIQGEDTAIVTLVEYGDFQ
jgi:hypothetical protein